VVSLGYDYSRNASLNEVNVVTDVNGKVLEPGYGESHEYSVRLRLFEDRLNLKVNLFNSLNRNISLGDAGLRQNLINFEQQLARNDPRTRSIRSSPRRSAPSLPPSASPATATARASRPSSRSTPRATFDSSGT